MGTSRDAAWHGKDVIVAGLFATPDCYKEEGSCLTHSNGLQSCLPNKQLEMNLITLEFFSKCIIRSQS